MMMKRAVMARKTMRPAGVLPAGAQGLMMKSATTIPSLPEKIRPVKGVILAVTTIPGIIKASLMAGSNGSPGTWPSAPWARRATGKITLREAQAEITWENFGGLSRAQGLEKGRHLPVS